MYGYGYAPQGYGPPQGGGYDMRGDMEPPTSYHMMSGPVGPPQYQGQVHANPQGGVMNGGM